MAMCYLKLYYDFPDEVEALSMEEVGRLVMAMLAFARTGALPDDMLTGSERFLFPMCRQRILRDREAYERKCAANRMNGALGGRPKKPDGSSETQNDRTKTKTKTKTNTKTKTKTEYKDVSVCVPPDPPVQEHDFIAEPVPRQENGDPTPTLRETIVPSGKRTVDSRPPLCRSAMPERTGDPTPTPGEMIAAVGDRTAGSEPPLHRGPTLEEVRSEAAKSAPHVDAERFWSHYTACGWRASGTPILNWRAKLRQWELSDRTRSVCDGWKAPPFKSAALSDQNSALNYRQREYRDEDFGDDFFLDLEHLEGYVV